MSSILNDETFNDTNKVKAMHSLVEIEKMNLKNEFKKYIRTKVNY